MREPLAHEHDLGGVVEEARAAAADVEAAEGVGPPGRGEGEGGEGEGGEGGDGGSHGSGLDAGAASSLDAGPRVSAR